MGDVLATIIGGLLAGIIIGPLARLVMPGKQDISWGMTILIGGIGALLGGFLADWADVGETNGIDWIKHAIQVGVAVVVVIIHGSMAGRRSGGTTPAT
jgi:uncharacterized membrane protein YeaQ/YmgE (transglycosylase-associated protein family)